MAENRRKEEKGKKEPRSKARALRPGELMVGDLVWSEVLDAPAIVKGIHEDGTIVTEDGKMRTFNVVVRGLEITGEVLLAMGLKKSRVIEGQYYALAPVEVEVGMFHDGKLLVYIYDDEKAQTMEGLEVRYVHELQHVLRVFGVDREPRWNLGVKDGTEI